MKGIIVFTDSQLKVIRFCAEECNRQSSGETSVANMVDAYNCATIELEQSNWSTNLVLELGFHVEPQKNSLGYRLTPVMLNYIAITPTMIPDNINRIMDGTREILGPGFNNDSRLYHANAFYQAFERIHPFIDGNGRVGAILYNMLLGNMDDPITPPEFRR